MSINDDVVPSPPPANMPFPLDDVHLWSIPLIQPPHYFHILQTSLCDEETQRAQRFIFEEHRRRFIIGRGALRDILSRYLGISAAAIQFHYQATGKPKLADTCLSRSHPPLHFNLAHSDDRAICAVTCGRPVGVDIERLRPMPDACRIAQRFFCQREYDLLQTLSGEEQTIAFFNAWTRKEAFLKARGSGLAESLASVEVSLLPDEPARLVTIADVTHERWQLWAPPTRDEYVRALVVTGDHVAVRLWQWDAPLTQ